MELKVLLEDCQYWIENNTHVAEEIAIRFKHRLVSIHCFPNGNGRHSRMMADVIMESIFDQEAFSWGQSNLFRSSNSRIEYIRALKQADQGDVRPLIKFAKN